MFCGRIILAVALLGFAVWARADSSATLDVEIGWGDQARYGHWVPAFVTASDSKPRNVVLEIDWPHDNNYTANIDQSFAIGPIPQTFPLYLPMGGGEREATFTLRDAHSGKAIASVKPYDLSANGIALNGGWRGGKLIGVSGYRSSAWNLSDQFRSDQRIAVSYLDPQRLPETPIGYDSLDLLVLDQPDLNPVSRGRGLTVSSDAQQAIVDWVRAGGCLLLWPGTGTLPNTSPLVDVLPCSVGQLFDVDPPFSFSIAGGHAAGKLSARMLTPKSGTPNRPFFDGHLPPGVMRRLGLGMILVEPISLAEFRLSDTDEKKKLWKPIFEAFGITWEEPNPNPTPDYGYFQAEPGSDEQLQQNATSSVTDALGNVPGAGTFGFSYVAVALIGMMILVGPLDWFVLKKFGRQPYTWLTTSVWIALLTLGALLAGHLIKSGNLYYRTLRLTDQADDQTVASIDMAGIYSPRTANYSIQAEHGWWQPAGTENLYYRGSEGWKTGIDFHQTWESNLAAPMSINVWNLRFLRGDAIAPGPPLIAASLTESPSDFEHTRPRIMGTIRNLTDHPLEGLIIETQNGSGRAIFNEDSKSATTHPSRSDQIAAGAEATVEFDLAPSLDSAQSPQQSGLSPTPNGGILDQNNEWWLSPRRTHAVLTTLKRDDRCALIYGRVVDAPAAAPLDPKAAIEEHRQLVRALVDLKK